MVPDKRFILYIYIILLRNKQFYENRFLFNKTIRQIIL
jgi:hypothetical protein